MLRLVVGEASCLTGKSNSIRHETHRIYMAKALAATRETLGLSSRDDAMTKLVAEKIIELAQRGLKNPTALHLAAIEEFKSDPQ
jgi:hypothetical protein